MCAFGNILAPILVDAHTVNNLDIGNEQGLENRLEKALKRAVVVST